MHHRRLIHASLVVMVLLAAGCTAKPGPGGIAQPSPGSTAGIATPFTIRSPAAFHGTAVIGARPGHETPADAYAGWLDAEVAGDFATACGFVLPSQQSTCPEEMPQAPIAIDGPAIRLGASDIYGTHALVVPLGTLCQEQANGTYQCLSNADRRAGIPGTQAAFAASYLEATQTDTDPTDGFDQVNGQWYLDLGSPPEDTGTA